MAGLISFAMPNGRLLVETRMTPAGRAKGFKGDSPAPGEGLMLVWEETGIRAITMQGVPADLDVIFLGNNGVVSKVVTLEAEIGRAVGAARYVLELASGEAARHGIRPGFRFRWSES